MTEYHHRTVAGRRLAWEVAKLRDASASLPVDEVALASIFEFDEVYWFDEEHRPTCRAVVEHARRIAAADTSDPILLSHDGWVVDGMHRVARAILDGNATIAARRLASYPPPDRESAAGGG